jgi:hypothetical protein
MDNIVKTSKFYPESPVIETRSAAGDSFSQIPEISNLVSSLTGDIHLITSKCNAPTQFQRIALLVNQSNWALESAKAPVYDK